MLLPFAGDRTSILPFILIGAAVILILGFIIYQSINKKDHSQYTKMIQRTQKTHSSAQMTILRKKNQTRAEYSNDSNDSDDTEE